MLADVPPHMIYLAAFFLTVLIGAMLLLPFRGLLTKEWKKKQGPPAPAVFGLTPLELHSSLQSQVVELQATDAGLEEHSIRFRQLLLFLREAKATFSTESAMLEIHIRALESLPHSDPSHLINLAALFNWSLQRSKEQLRAIT